MWKLVTITLIGGLAAPALGQVTSSQAPDAPTPLFRLTVVGRTTPAINYRPESGNTKIDLLGTPLLPAARGVAEVAGNKGHFEIDARVEKIQPATHFGNEYLTYVVWAITPEGRAQNLGELRLDGDEGRVETTTELQTFSLIVTAEPYFAVTQPSDVVVLENVVGENRRDVQTVQVTYELLKRGAYLMDSSAGFTRPPPEPGAPLDLAEARNALELARIAGADQYAADTFSKASRLLEDAELARQRGKRGNEVMMPARQAVQTAEDARLIAMEHQERAFTARQHVLAAQRESAATEREREALERTQAAEVRRQQAQVEVEQVRADAQTARQAANTEAEQARLQAERAQSAAAAEAQQSRLQALRAQAAAAVAEQERNELRERLREQLNAILETRETARGLITEVPDVLFQTASATLTAEAREKLARVGGILAAQPDLHISIEGHTDNVGDDEENRQLSDRRAAAVLAYLVQQKIPLTIADTAGFGESRPVANNDTAAGRRQNRRVEVIVTGESIGVRPSDAAQ
jgi:outer membrane protein OmpA-like peptidoglycan-associated protein